MDEKWFKKKQREAGVTAEDIARIMGRDRSAVSHIYTGQRRMSLEWAEAFAKALRVTVSEVLEKSGATSAPVAQQLQPGFAEGEAARYVPPSSERRHFEDLARALGGGKPGVDVWTVQSNAMILDGYRKGDLIVVDTKQSELCKKGDAVVAQIYDRGGTARTVFRRYEPPTIMSHGTDVDDVAVNVVDHDVVVIRGKVIGSWRKT